MNLNNKIEMLLKEMHFEPIEKQPEVKGLPVVKRESFTVEDKEKVTHTFEIIHKTKRHNYEQSFIVGFDDAEFLCRSQGRMGNEDGVKFFAGLPNVLKNLFNQAQNLN